MVELLFGRIVTSLFIACIVEPLNLIFLFRLNIWTHFQRRRCADLLIASHTYAVTTVSCSSKSSESALQGTHRKPAPWHKDNLILRCFTGDAAVLRFFASTKLCKRGVVTVRQQTKMSHSQCHKFYLWERGHDVQPVTLKSQTLFTLFFIPQHFLLIIAHRRRTPKAT